MEEGAVQATLATFSHMWSMWCEHIKPHTPHLPRGMWLCGVNTALVG